MIKFVGFQCKKEERYETKEVHFSDTRVVRFFERM